MPTDPQPPPLPVPSSAPYPPPPLLPPPLGQEGAGQGPVWSCHSNSHSHYMQQNVHQVQHSRRRAAESECSERSSEWSEEDDVHDKPPGAPNDETGNNLSDALATLDLQGALPEGWRMSTDAQGCVYYLNDVSRTTQWHRPTAPATASSQTTTPLSTANATSPAPATSSTQTGNAPANTERQPTTRTRQ